MHDNASEPRATPSAVYSNRVTAVELEAFRRQLAEIDFDLEQLDPHRCTVPESIGRFEIQERIGSGSFGSVFLAYDPRLTRNVAIKLAHVGTHSSHKMQARFLHEAHAAARLAHPNVVSLHEYGEEGGLLYLVYEMCDGPTLEQWMAERPDRTPTGEAISIVRQLASGLAHAHGRGLVHRDVKPGNILLQPTEEPSQGLPFTPRITDFGLAHDLLEREQLTFSQGLFGTIDYMSPEQAQGSTGDIQPASDLYSVGVILYRLLTGTLPIQYDNLVEALQAVCIQPARRLRAIDKSIPRDLEAICLKCLEKDPRRRYHSCEELVRDLDRFRFGGAVLARPLTVTERVARTVRTAPVVSSLAASIIVICVASVIVFSSMAWDLHAKQVRLGATLNSLQHSREAAVRAEALTAKALDIAQLERDEAKRQAIRAMQSSYRADLRRAYAAADEGFMLIADDILRGIRQDIEGYFEPLCDFRLLEARLARGNRRFNPHQAPATEVERVWGTDLVVSASHDGYLQFHSLKTGKLENAIALGAPIDALAVSPDGKLIAVSYHESERDVHYVKVHPLQIDRTHDLNWIAPAQPLAVTPSTVEALAFSNCSSYLAVGPRYHAASICNLAEKTIRAVPTTHRNSSLSFSPDGQHCLVMRKGNAIQVVDVASAEVSQEIHCGAELQCTCWSPDGRWIAYALYRDEAVRLVEAVTSDREPRVLRQNRGAIQSLAFNEDSSLIAAGTSRGAIATWKLPLGAAEAAPAAAQPAVQCTILHKGIVTDLVFGDEGRLISASDSGTVISSPATAEEHEACEPNVTSVALSRTSSVDEVVLGSTDGRVVRRLLNGTTVDELYQSHQAPVSKVVESPGGTWLGVGWNDGQLAVIEHATGKVTHCHYPPPVDSLDERKIKDIAFSPDEQLFAACGDDGRVRLWNVASPEQPRWEFTSTSYAYSLAFVKNDRLALGGMFEEIYIFDVAQGQVLRRIEGASRTQCLLYDDHFGRLVSGHDDGRIRLYDQRTYELLAALEGNAGGVTTLAQTPSLECYLSGDNQGKLKVWNARDREFVGTLLSLDGESQLQMLGFPTTSKLVVHSLQQDSSAGPHLWSLDTQSVGSGSDSESSLSSSTSRHRRY